ncbi:PEP-CTERM sorting domain-containing protein [Klebsiella pneumoniae]
MVTVNAVAAIPEPQTYALMLSGLLAVAFMARRRRG